MGDTGVNVTMDVGVRTLAEIAGELPVLAEAAHRVMGATALASGVLKKVLAGSAEIHAIGSVVVVDCGLATPVGRGNGTRNARVLGNGPGVDDLALEATCLLLVVTNMSEALVVDNLHDTADLLAATFVSASALVAVLGDAARLAAVLDVGNLAANMLVVAHGVGACVGVASLGVGERRASLASVLNLGDDGARAGSTATTTLASLAASVAGVVDSPGADDAVDRAVVGVATLSAFPSVRTSLPDNLGVEVGFRFSEVVLGLALVRLLARETLVEVERRVVAVRRRVSRTMRVGTLHCEGSGQNRGLTATPSMPHRAGILHVVTVRRPGGNEPFLRERVAELQAELVLLGALVREVVNGLNSMDVGLAGLCAGLPCAVGAALAVQRVLGAASPATSLLGPPLAERDHTFGLARVAHLVRKLELASLVVSPLGVDFSAEVVGVLARRAGAAGKLAHQMLELAARAEVAMLGHLPGTGLLASMPAALGAVIALGLFGLGLVFAAGTESARGVAKSVGELALGADSADSLGSDRVETANLAFDAVRDGAVAAAPAVDTVVASGEGERGLAVETNHAVGALSLGLVSLVLATRAVVAVSRALDGNGEPALLA